MQPTDKRYSAVPERLLTLLRLPSSAKARLTEKSTLPSRPQSPGRRSTTPRAASGSTPEIGPRIAPEIPPLLLQIFLVHPGLLSKLGHPVPGLVLSLCHHQDWEELFFRPSLRWCGLLSLAKLQEEIQNPLPLLSSCFPFRSTMVEPSFE